MWNDILKTDLMSMYEKPQLDIS